MIRSAARQPFSHVQRLLRAVVWIGGKPTSIIEVHCISIMSLMVLATGVANGNFPRSFVIVASIFAAIVILSSLSALAGFAYLSINKHRHLEEIAKLMFSTHETTRILSRYLVHKAIENTPRRELDQVPGRVADLLTVETLQTMCLPQSTRSVLVALKRPQDEAVLNFFDKRVDAPGYVLPNLTPPDAPPAWTGRLSFSPLVFIAFAIFLLVSCTSLALIFITNTLPAPQKEVATWIILLAIFTGYFVYQFTSYLLDWAHVDLIPKAIKKMHRNRGLSWPPFGTLEQLRRISEEVFESGLSMSPEMKRTTVFALWRLGDEWAWRRLHQIAESDASDDGTRLARLALRSAS